MIDEPPSPRDYQWAGRVQPSRTSGRRTWLAVAAVAILSFVAGAVAGRPGASGALAAGSPSTAPGGATPVTTASGSPVPTPVASAATPAPAFAVTGVVPGPDVMAPAGAPRIPELTLGAVAQAAASLGLACDSARVGDRFYWLACEGASATSNLRSSVRSYYSALDAVANVEIVVQRLDLNRSPDDLDAATSILRPFAHAVSVGDSNGPDWLDDPTCNGPECAYSIHGVTLIPFRSSTERRLVIFPTATPPSPQEPRVIGGTMPGPDATLPPGVTAIPGLQLATIALLTSSLALDCQSQPYYPIDAPLDGSFELVCEGADPLVNAAYTVTARYWTLSAVSQLEVDLRSVDMEIPVLDPTAEIRLLEPLAEVAGRDPAWLWVSSTIDDPSCSPGGCLKTFAGLQFEAQWGRSGWRTMRVEIAHS